jgi:hypothetical protein
MKKTHRTYIAPLQISEIGTPLVLIMYKKRSRRYDGEEFQSGRTEERFYAQSNNRRMPTSDPAEANLSGEIFDTAEHVLRRLRNPWRGRRDPSLPLDTEPM